MDHSPYNMGDGSMEPRKRSKVSRACDECRRKKIRCDAKTESGDEQCSSCKRVGTRCQFSRVPMKRGPSKGLVCVLSIVLVDSGLTSTFRYIKELADRLNNLEGAIQAGEIPQYPPMHHEGGSRPASNEYSPPPNLDSSQPRKRTFSSISNEFSPAYQPQRPSATWTPSETPRHLPPPSSAYQMSQPAGGEQGQAAFRTHYSPNGLAPQAVWSSAPETPLRAGASFGAAGQVDQNYSDHKIDWDDNLING
jgi:Fungal Zn(2)-Cys(6) binuclear cluster domain